MRAPSRNRHRTPDLLDESTDDGNTTMRRSTRSCVSSAANTTTRGGGGGTSFIEDESISPTALAKKLVTINEDANVMHLDDNAVAVELKGFHAMADMEEYEKKRDELKNLVDDEAHFSSRTELNLDDAVLAGAKMLVDERRSTRSFSKKLERDCGVAEDSVLYKGLDYRGHEASAAKNVLGNRQASVAESLVDFHKQMQFKMTVLDGVARKCDNALSKSDTRITRQAREAEQKEKAQEAKRAAANARLARAKAANDNKTPAMRKQINPLDERRIIEEYALEVASEVRGPDAASKKRRRIAPPPYDIHLLDDVDF